MPTDNGHKRRREGEPENTEEFGLRFGFYPKPESWDEMNEIQKDAEKMKPGYRLAIGVDGRRDPKLPTRTQVALQMNGENQWFNFAENQCEYSDVIHSIIAHLAGEGVTSGVAPGSVCVAATPQGEVVGAIAMGGSLLTPLKWIETVYKMLDGNEAMRNELLKGSDYKPQKMRTLWGDKMSTQFYIHFACTGGGDMRPTTLYGEPVEKQDRAPALKGVMKFMLSSMAMVIDALYVQPTVKRMIDEKWKIGAGYACRDQLVKVARRLCHYDLFSRFQAWDAWRAIGFKSKDADMSLKMYKPVFGNNGEMPVIEQPKRRSNEKMMEIYGDL